MMTDPASAAKPPDRDTENKFILLVLFSLRFSNSMETRTTGDTLSYLKETLFQLGYTENILPKIIQRILKILK